MDVPEHSEISHVLPGTFLINYMEAVIMKNVFPPRYGEPIPLLCTECKRMFIGPNPKGTIFFDDFLNLKKRAKCPNCGSKKVVPHPGVHF